ncbi:MAG TPA: bifunctional 5,10-methylenetetrahydrofolate dehydrogenase/5,10-methenyltetrahydrofolate cyclohydrolase [Polyangiales bacterium]|nr:bifunctional 5,10-methylenetetrahydrofolate dehydrogenase/5,10-methenyltetrahydrofolate cyclohydrolase [Polyangiales bacterium]
MTAQLIDGKAIAAKVQREVSESVAAFQAEHGRVPALHAILVGDDPSSAIFVRNKERALAASGMTSQVMRLPATTSEAELVQHVRALNADENVDGILVQLPLPAAVDADHVIGAIDPRKDVDGITPFNAGLLASGRPALIPCTPLGCLRLLHEVQFNVAGKRVLVIGRGALVGRPIAHLLLTFNATVTIAHSQTTDLAELVKQADLVVAAAGQAGLVHGEWIKPGAVVLDAGLNRNAEGKLCGDVEHEAAKERASFITPVPGGIGPMTTVTLAVNTLAAARARLA